MNDITAGQPVTFALNAAGIALIDVAGETAFGLREGHDVENQETIASSVVGFTTNSGATYLAQLTVIMTSASTVTNNGNFMTRPVITITSNAAANNDIFLINTTDNNNAFEYADPDFDDTDAVEIDPTDGTVIAQKGGGPITTIQYFAGRFPRLLPGANYYQFIGLDSDLTFTFREAWL